MVFSPQEITHDHLARTASTCLLKRFALNIARQMRQRTVLPEMTNVAARRSATFIQRGRRNSAGRQLI